MARRQTKADRILNDAAMRLEAARIRERTAQSQLNVATATLKVLQEAYDSLEKELAPIPRKSKAKATPNASAPKEPKTARDDAPKSNGQLCIAKIPGLGVDCNDPEDNKVHDKNAGYAGYHPFTPPAQSAGKKPGRKGAAANSTANSEAEKVSATAVGGKWGLKT